MKEALAKMGIIAQQQYLTQEVQMLARTDQILPQVAQAYLQQLDTANDPIILGQLPKAKQILDTVAAELFPPQTK